MPSVLCGSSVLIGASTAWVSACHAIAPAKYIAVVFFRSVVTIPSRWMGRLFRFQQLQRQIRNHRIQSVKPTMTRGTIRREPQAVPRLSRVCAFIAVLFITADVGLCPFFCLLDDSPAHEASNLPAQANSCGGTCSSASSAVSVDVSPRPAMPARPVFRPAALQLPPAPTFDIDHPPRLAESVHA